jgi:SWI/SNF related-matrix-associated actin-dependent regulator of chromatin subfamily C
MQVDPQTRPSNIGPPFTGHFRVTADTPRGLQAFQPGPNIITTPGKPHPSTDRATSATPASKADLNLEIRRNIYDDKGKEIKAKEESEKATNGEEAAINGIASGDGGTKAMEEAAKEPKKTFNCYSCGIDCTRCRFHYAKHEPASASSNPNEIKYDLCPNCYFQARMPSTHRSSDFVKLEEPEHTTIPDKDAPWTDSETLLLLEGLENFDDNWTQISNHVGTRTREECVMKFLQLEIQDKYVDDDLDREIATGRALNGRDPISQLENPVMSVISFLAQMADPAVVAAATGRSVEVMQKELRTELEKGMGGKKEREIKSEETMEIDGDATPAPKTNGQSNGNPLVDMATIGLATAGARAGALASHEEREMTRLVGAAVNLTLQKFELKLAQFSEMEEIVQAERRDLEKGRQQLFLDRLAFKKRMKDMEDTFRAASLKAPEEGMRMMQESLGMTSGKRFGFQSANAVTNGVGPLSAEAEDFKSVEI